MKRTLAVALASLLGAAPLSSAAGAPAAVVAPPGLAGLQAALNQRVAAQPGTGIVVGVIDGNATHVYIAGSAGNGRPLDARTLFEIGSVTKTFTATILASMVRSGAVKLNAPISAYVPAGIHTPSKGGRAITLLDLAEQRSGLPRMPDNLGNADINDPYASYGNAKLFAFLNGYRLTRAPGAKFVYSNYGLGLLGQLLARAAKTSYAALLQARVLDPLGMRSTVLETPGLHEGARFAIGHNLSGRPVAPWHFEAIAPAGAIRSDLDDMLKYLRCNMGVGPLAATCRFAQRPRANGAPGHRIGLVWWINKHTGNIWHGGDTAGFHAAVAIAANRRLGVVALSNGPLIEDVVSHVLEPKYPIALCPTAPLAPAESDPQRYVGLYCNAASGMLFRVAPGPRNGTLTIALAPQPAFTYAQVAPDRFYEKTYRALIVFARQGANVVGLRLEQNGQEVPCLRIGANGTPMVAQLPSALPTAVVLAPALLAQYVGTYVFAPGVRFHVTLEGSQLAARLTGQPSAPIYASAKDRFFYKVVDAQLTFERNAAGSVDAVVLHQDGRTLLGKRSTASP